MRQSFSQTLEIISLDKLRNQLHHLKVRDMSANTGSRACSKGQAVCVHRSQLLWGSLFWIPTLRREFGGVGAEDQLVSVCDPGVDADDGLGWLLALCLLLQMHVWGWEWVFLRQAGNACRQYLGRRH